MLSFGVSAGWLTGQSHEFAYGASAEIAYLLNGHYQVFVGANGERYFYSSFKFR
jgi:hypothetical protein